GKGGGAGGNGRLFPRGIRGEPLSALRRAHLVVVTNPAGSGVTQQIGWSLRREGSHASVLTGSYRAEALREGDAREQSPACLSGRRVVALAGLGPPARLPAPPPRRPALWGGRPPPPPPPPARGADPLPG